ncbi:endonuclease III domain-containing protein [Kallotenue papyrolyticum]|uniref:endonuclease III domain-containing protein n=1 Tax=Kallotenue papyrolyticum TaxID=1325125 RepID=UPI0004785D06|nr:endonuclease III [Kallotenue papyrolyticum]
MDDATEAAKHPSAAPAEPLQARALEMYQRLLQTYGHRPLVPRREPMHELISTILSHRTTGRNEELAYQRMIARFGSWEAIRDAPVDELTAAIAPANYAEQKAPRIKEVLRRIIAERGAPTLDFLRAMPLSDAMAWLTALPGVGPKTASLVLLFCFGRPVLPVDTHVHRVTQRVGLIGPKVDAAAAHALLLRLLPPDPELLFNFHINTLRHGQRVCVWGTPRCSRCVLTDLCDYYLAGRPRA